MLTTIEIAKHFDVAYSTVILWIKSGKLEGAVKEPNPRGDIWLVPESALKTFDRGQKGRPRKSQSDTSAGLNQSQDAAVAESTAKDGKRPRRPTTVDEFMAEKQAELELEESKIEGRFGKRAETGE